MYGTARDFVRSPTSPARRPFWLIVRDDRECFEVLVAELVGGEQALPVFSFREEAGLFLMLGVVGPDWRIKETGVGELSSVLLGPCRHVERVALDPLPGGIGVEPVNRLVSTSRASFLAFLPSGRLVGDPQ